MALPDFLIAGAPKAGTTALHSALARHPSLFMAAVKEPKFFLTDGPPPAKGGPGDAKTYREHVWRRADYEALFDPAPSGTLRGESTPFYLYRHDAQLRIRALIPQARLIIVLRDPVERAHSNWAHLWSAGLDPIGDFVQACRVEEQRKVAGWADFWRYKDLGRYGRQIEQLYTVFPADQVLVIRYREMIEDPVGTLDRICGFLGVKAGVISEVPRENVTAHPHETRRHLALSKLARGGSAVTASLPGHAGSALTDRLEQRLQRGAAPRRPLTWDERAQLIGEFTEDVTLLSSITGQDFTDWVRPRENSGGLVGARPAGQSQARNGRPREY
jgi:hypothetical protein